MHRVPDDEVGPTAERLKHAGGWSPDRNQFFTAAGQSKSSRRFQMLDDQLGRAWVRRFISAEEYSGLKKYALHWLAGGLQSHMGSVDLNRILAFDPSSMNGLAKTERQADHRSMYWRAHEHLGTRPAYVADHIACFDTSVSDVAIMMGYRSPYHGREKVREILSDAGYRLTKLWDDLAKGR